MCACGKSCRKTVNGAKAIAFNADIESNPGQRAMRRVVTADVYKSAGMKIRTVAASLLLAWHSSYNPAYAADLGEPEPIYSEAELIKLIEENKHLKRVKADNCQIVEDIFARATRINLPSYEFLYGDMLAGRVCGSGC